MYTTQCIPEIGRQLFPSKVTSSSPIIPLAFSFDFRMARSLTLTVHLSMSQDGEFCIPVATGRATRCMISLTEWQLNVAPIYLNEVVSCCYYTIVALPLSITARLTPIPRNTFNHTGRTNNRSGNARRPLILSPQPLHSRAQSIFSVQSFSLFRYKDYR